jgi:glycosyltransferase involved in cell wall biosynthesis
MKKKILYVITKGNFGGAQRYVFDLATHLPIDRFESVVAFGEGETLGKKLIEAGIRTIQVPSLKRDIWIFSDIVAFFALWKIILKEKPHVLHLNSSKAGGLGVVVGRMSRVPRIIFTGHAWAFNEERSFFVKIVLLKIYWWIIKLSHKTIAVSGRTADQVSWMPFIKKKVSVIYNGVETFETLSQTDARKKLDPDTVERTWIGTVSELHRSKGLDYLIGAFAVVAEKFANVALIIVGGGEQEKKLKEQAEKLGLEKRVVFAGFVPDARKYLKAFDVFTLTSRTEAFPYAPLEAGLANVPVVASWAGGIPEIITNKESGFLIDPTKTNELAEILEQLIVEPRLGQETAKELYEKVSKKFTIEQMVQKTIALY